jgi:predicted enzyme related to lactoylglutathione lyase
MKNAISFFEIPVADFDRAVRFYSAILERELVLIERTDPLRRFAVFPCAADGVGGALLYTQDFAPSATGTLIYLRVECDLNETLDRITSFGGRVMTPKTRLDEGCYYATFIDTEGNLVGLHSTC